MPGPFVHHIDPVIAGIGGVYFWWYGLSYSLGFLELLLYLRRRRQMIGLTLAEVYSLTLLFSVGVLAGGRAVEIAFDEWPFYRNHLWLVPAYWLGGMATHGLLAGAAIGIGTFCLMYRKPLRQIADTLVIPGAFFLGVGRIGNFIDGQIVGSVTSGWWGVQFPDAEGFRHPVVLYDGLKNLALVPIVIGIGRLRPIPGTRSAHFIFWYAFLRLFVDLFREYPSHRLALGTGQTLNIVMTLAGAALVAKSEWRWKRAQRGSQRPHPRVGDSGAGHLMPKRVAFALLLWFSALIPSNWTQDVPEKYGTRHPGLRHSVLYPAIETAPPIIARGGTPSRRSAAPRRRARPPARARRRTCPRRA